MKNGDQPAYPAYTFNSEGQITDRSDEGLTKREYFAAMAMQGMCAGGYFQSEVQKQAEQVGSDIEVAIALAAVCMADQLLILLEKK